MYFLAIYLLKISVRQPWLIFLPIPRRKYESFNYINRLEVWHKIVTILLAGDGEEGCQLRLCSLTASFSFQCQKLCTLLKSTFGLVRQDFCIALWYWMGAPVCTIPIHRRKDITDALKLTLRGLFSC